MKEMVSNFITKHEKLFVKIAATLSIMAVILLNVFKLPMATNYLWLVCNAFFVCYHYNRKENDQLMMFAVYFIFSVVGIFRWSG